MKQNEFSPEELEFISLLEPAGVPDDLPEVLSPAQLQPTPQVLARIKDRTMQKIQENCVLDSSRSKVETFGKLRLVWVAAAVLLVAVAFMSAVGPGQVAAKIKGVFKYIGGIGLWGSEEIILVAERPVKVEGKGVVLEVRGLAADSKVTLVRLLAYGNWSWPKEEPAYLVDDMGNKYLHTGSSASSGGRETEAWLAFEPLRPSARYVSLFIPDRNGTPDAWQLGIPLVAGNNLLSAGEIGPTQYLRGFAVTARAESRPDETTVTLLVRANRDGSVIEEVGRYTSTAAARKPALKNKDNGKEYPFRAGSTRIKGNPYIELRELRFGPIEPEARSVVLSVPLIRVREEGRAKVTLPVPGDEPIMLNRVVKFGRFDLKLIKAELVDCQIRVYVDLGPDGDEVLESFRLEFKESGSMMSRAGEYTDRMIYFQTPVLPNQKRITLTLIDPVVAVTGPWELELPVEK